MSERPSTPAEHYHTNLGRRAGARRRRRRSAWFTPVPEMRIKKPGWQTLRSRRSAALKSTKTAFLKVGVSGHGPRFVVGCKFRPLL